jgi:hypothetical protein
LKKELEAKDSKILFLNREILLRNNTEEDKENGAVNAIESAKKRYSSGVVNAVLNNESLSKSIFKTGKKRNLMELYENNVIPPCEGYEPNGKRKKII